MIPKDCKRLAEVDFPIAEVSRHSAREKSIRHGHPSTLHLWWARRPLASCRAVLLALLWPDPCDPLCPEEFKEKARKLLPQVPNCNPGTTDQELRQALLKFIADFANWNLAANRTYLDVSRSLVKAAYGEEPPLVVDPFAGGGSIPLEALRVGCEAFASDLNPVACLILKVMLEDIPRHGPKLAEELRRLGAEIKNQAERKLAEFYPKDPDGATPIAYLWARTVRCESPNCGAEIPLVRSFWLRNKGKERLALGYEVVRKPGAIPRVRLELFSPKDDREVPPPTVSQARAKCLCCSTVLPKDRLKAQLREQRGGANSLFNNQGDRVGGAVLLAVVTVSSADKQRRYRVPTDRDYRSVFQSTVRLAEISAQPSSLTSSAAPDEFISTPMGHEYSPGDPYFKFLSILDYGITKWRDLFTLRQQLALAILSANTRVAGSDAVSAVREGLALALGKVLRHCNVIAKWHRGSETVAGAFGMHALPMSWDFPEMYPFCAFAGGYDDSLSDAIESVTTVSLVDNAGGQVSAADATCSPLPDDTAAVFFTDPPYYDAIPYADLSDFFFVWHKRTLPNHLLLRDQFDARNPLSPKAREMIDNLELLRGADKKSAIKEGIPVKDKAHFEESMFQAFSEGRRTLSDNGVGCIVFAHKTTEGWEALLSGITRAGWVIAGSWPIATERGARLRARESAALATSVHLICRPRPDEAGVGDWAEVLRELPKRVGDWMERLQSEGVRGADLVFACIGPALEIFSRHAKVETADGREIALAEYLEKVWEVVGRSALAQVLGTGDAKARHGAAGTLEEDARLTALFLWTLQSTSGEATEDTSDEVEDEETSDDEDDEDTSRGKAKGFTLVFDVVRRFAQPLGIDLPKWEGRVIETKKGVVRLLPIAERAKQLFGEDGAQAVAARLELETALGSNPLQGMLFPEMEITPKVRGRGARGRGKRAGIGVSDESLAAAREATTLDRIHAAMLLQAGGRTNALRALLKAEQVRSPDFLRLANALSALYPKGSEEKRLLDAMLLTVPR